MISKYDVTPKTLASPIIKAGLSAVSQLEEFSHSKDNYFIVGGVAVQSYLPKEYRRHTQGIPKENQRTLIFV